MKEDENLLDHQWHQLEDQQREEEEWWKGMDNDPGWIRRTLKWLEDKT